MDKELYNKCLICGKTYKRCRACEENRGTWAAWKQFTDNPECFQILTCIQGYTTKVVSKEDTAKELKKCNLANKSTFLPRIQELIDEILMEDIPSTDLDNTKDPITENSIKVEPTDDTREVESSEISTTLSHRRSKKSRRTTLPNM